MSVNIKITSECIEVECPYKVMIAHTLNEKFKKIGGRWNSDVKLWCFEKEKIAQLIKTLKNKKIMHNLSKVKQNTEDFKNRYEPQISFVQIVSNSC